MNEIIAIRQGDAGAFKRLYEQHHEKLYFYILKKTSSSYLTEEVVQITFIKLWNFRQGLSETIEPGTQIFRIAKTSLVDLLRKNAAQRNMEETYRDLLPAPEDTTTSRYDQRERSLQIADLVENMPPMRKEVFKLSREEGLSHKEIAVRLSLTPKNVENHIAKAIRQIKKGLKLLLFLVLVAAILSARFF